MQRISAACAVALVIIASSCGGSTDSGALSGTGLGVVTDPTTTVADLTPNEPTSDGSSPTTAPLVADTIPADSAPLTTPPSAPTTTAPATTAPASTPATTASPPPSTPDLALRSNGIGPYVFGSIGASDFAAAVAPALGAPTQFTAETYPSDAGSYYENIDDESGFTFPVGETVCFANALCAYFGGASAAAVTLVGYSQDENSAALRTPSGVSSGSVWADYSGAISVDNGGCFSTGYGHVDGVDLVLLSIGEPFEYYDAATETYVQSTPAQADVRVISLHAGDRPFFLYEDC